jgi:hypothetical protein
VPLTPELAPELPLSVFGSTLLGWAGFSPGLPELICPWVPGVVVPLGAGA